MMKLHVRECQGHPGDFEPVEASHLYVLQELIRPSDPNRWDLYRTVPLPFIVAWKNQYKLFIGSGWQVRRRENLSRLRIGGNPQYQTDIQIVDYNDPQRITKYACLMIDWESLYLYSPKIAWDWYAPHSITVTPDLAQAVFEQQGWYPGTDGRKVAYLSVNGGYESLGETERLGAYDEDGRWCGNLTFEPWRRDRNVWYRGKVVRGLNSGSQWWADTWR